MATVESVSKKDCTGCKMCGDICPVGAISFEINKEGFWYPKVDANKCINCGLCEAKCPAVNIVKQDNYAEPIVYAGWTLDNDIRYESTSGGVYYELGKMFIENGGYIVGCAYTDDYMSAIHMVGNNHDDLMKIMGSKYFQSDTEGIYTSVKKLLEDNKKVMFCGAPCQVAGLISFLGKTYDNLFLLDFICKGINSPLAYRQYMKEIEDNFGSKIVKVRLKSKKTGWESLATHVDFENGKEYHKDRYTDWWIRGYTCGNLFMRENCQNCKYKQMPRLADVTFGDFWGVTKCSKEDMERGISVIFVNSKHGEKLMKAVSDRMHLEIRSMDEVYAGNPYFLGQATQHENRKLFFEELENKPFTQAVKASYVESLSQKLKRNIKFILKKLGRTKW